MNRNYKGPQRRKKSNAMGIFSLLIMLLVAITVIIVIALTMQSGLGNVSIPDASNPSADNSSGTVSDTSEASSQAPESAPAVSSPEVSTPDTSTPDVSAPEVSTPGVEYEYRTDVSSFMWAIEPANRDGYLLLVNGSNTLSSTYSPENLVAVRFTRSDRSSRFMIEEAEAALYAFLTEAAEYGYDDVTVTSAYRTYAEQNSLFQNKVSQYISRYPTREEAEDKAATVVARPGTSEHQSGLTCDMHNMSSAQQSFGKTDAAKWLAANAHKFGFILRYEESKEDITGVIYEPWHFRYVGRYHATQMYNLGMCLEEYTDYLNK